MPKSRKTNKQSQPQKREKEQLLHPEGANAYFANYFTVETSEDDLVVGFGQKLPLSDGKKEVYEIRRRVVMTSKGAGVFSKLLNDALKNLKKSKK